jgi:hypothetical protein
MLARTPDKTPSALVAMFNKSSRFTFGVTGCICFFMQSSIDFLLSEFMQFSLYQAKFHESVYLIATRAWSSALRMFFLIKKII